MVSEKKMNKKGIFFTLLAIAILSLFLISYTFYSATQGRKAIQKRVETLNNFVFSVEQDLERQVYVAGFRAIFLFETKIISGDYVPAPLDKRFNETFFDGIVYGEAVPSDILKDATFSAMLNSLNEKTKKVNVDINMTAPVFTATQDDPWSVKFVLTANLTIKDKNGLASWSKRADIVAYVPIKYFTDPVYLVNANGISNKIVQAPVPITNLYEHAQKQYYINTTLSPSFLDRLQGDLNAQSPYGIESIVDRTNPNIPGKEGVSCVDYIYFSDSPDSGCAVNSAYSWLKIDTEHLSIYGAGCV